MAAVVLLSERDRQQARELIESEGLRLETDADEFVGLYEEGRLVATGARSGYVLKMVAIAPSHQGGGALGEVISLLIDRGKAAGHDTLLVFTRPDSVSSFERLNFRLLLAHGQAALLEFGPGFQAYLQGYKSVRRAGRNGAVVINGNPFTLGHLHLTETASRQVDHLYLFVVREDRSVFPFATRLELARESTAHIPNLLVLETSRSAVSAGTFPSYFLKRLDDAALLQMQFDLRLFATLLAPAFSVRERFVGEEPYCAVTAAYNRAMPEVLREYGIEWMQIPRRAQAGEPISATRVRAALARGEFDRIASWVPPATLRFLGSADGEAIARRLASATEGR